MRVASFATVTGVSETDKVADIGDASFKGRDDAVLER
jgi:hypothetical protein